jgi:hypothetical protein
MKDRNDRATPRRGISRDRADDEGLEENMQSSSKRSRSGNVQVDDVRDANSISRTTERHRSKESGGSFEGQGGQKGGNRGSEQGTGDSEDRSDQLREDDSLSGSPGREGKSGSRQSRQPSTKERASEQSEKNARDDVDRTLMYGVSDSGSAGRQFYHCAHTADPAARCPLLPTAISCRTGRIFWTYERTAHAPDPAR